MSKLTWHVQYLHQSPWLPPLVLRARPEYVKLMHPPSTDPWPGVRTIGRHYLPDGDTNRMIAEGRAGAAEWYAACRGPFHGARWVYAWELPNEPQPMADWQFRAKLAEFTVEAARLMHGDGLRCVGMNWGVGWPDRGHAGGFRTAVEACDLLGLHEYAWATMQDGGGFWTLRYRRTLAELREAGCRIPPVIVGECGLTNAVIPGRPDVGYQTQPGWTRSGYLAQLQWYDAELARDPEVVAAAVFTSGPDGRWTTFDVDEPLSVMLAEHIERTRPQTPDTMPVMVDLRGQLPTGEGEYERRGLDRIKRVVIHHSGPPGWLPGVKANEYAKRIAESHVRAGWPGIGYHFVVGGNGMICWTQDLETVSYHTSGYNQGGVGVCLIGDFRKSRNRAPTMPQRLAAQSVVDWLHFKVGPLAVAGHKDLRHDTTCPGDTWGSEWEVT